MTTRETISYLAAATALAAGYADLWRGGTELASILLVGGYLIALPYAIWLRASRTVVAPPRTEDRPPYLAAALTALALFALYVATLAPSTAMWDTSEYIAVAKVLGLPHPPGNPTFVLLAHVAGMLPLSPSYAVRINLLAALASAASAALWFLCADRLLRTTIERKPHRLVAAAFATVLSGTAFTVWNQSVVNEKVYTVSLFGLALSSWLVIRWLDTREDLTLVMLAYLTGIAYTVHPAGFLVLPAIGIAVLARAPRTLLRPRLLVTCAAVLLLGLTPFAFEPIRAGHHPPINEGVPTACTGAKPELSCTFTSQTARLLSANIRREQYGGHPVMERQAPFGAQVGMFWLYFRWQWLRDVSRSAPVIQSVLAALFLMLGAYGLAAQRSRDRDAWWYFVPLMATLTVALVFYLNFKYGWSQAQELGDTVPREVRDRDYFYVWTFSTWGLFAGVGLAVIWRELADSLAARGVTAHRAWALASPVLALALVPLVANGSAASRAGHHFTAAWASDLLNSVEPYGVIVTNGDNDSFPLWYAQEVEGIRRDVTVALVPYLGIADYQLELMRRPQQTYDAARGPAIFRNGSWKKPEHPVWNMTPAEVKAIPDYFEVREPQRFRSGLIDATVPPQYLTRDKIAILRAIQDTFPERPIFFVGAGWANTLGLGPWLRQQGLVQKLEPDSVSRMAGTVTLDGMAIDLPRTEALWRSYRAPKQLLREGKWIDAASHQIPLAYMVAAQELAQAWELTGRHAEALAMIDTLRAMARVVNIRLE